MEIKLEKNNGNVTIVLVGRLDTITSVELNDFFEAKQEEIIKEAGEKVVLDFKDLEYVSSAGLRALLAMKKALVKVGKDLEIQNINNIIREVFDVTGFGKTIKIV
ncbi:MAG: STAS domain-containing protein [Bacilli bacterium]|nr:STAS domain-containing protein [Bacilli bacterium]